MILPTTKALLRQTRPLQLEGLPPCRCDALFQIQLLGPDHRGSTGDGGEGTQKSRKKWGEWWIWDEFDELIRYGKFGKDGEFDGLMASRWMLKETFYSQKCPPNGDLMDLRWGLEDYFCPLSKKGAVLVMAKWMFTVKTWLVVYLPLWKIWLHQLGWWHSQYMAK